MATYEFDQDFQDRIATLILKDNSIISSVRSVVHPNYFTDPVLKNIVSMAMEFHKKYKLTPDRSEFIEYCRKELGKDGISKIKQLYRIRIKNPQVVFEQVVDFAQYNALREAILDSSELISDKDNRIQIRDLIGTALRVGVDSRRLGTDLLCDRTSRILRRLKYGINVNKISTGLKNLDKILGGGGPDRGELAMLMSPPKGFKTGMIANMAFSVIAQRLKAVIYTLEVSEANYTMRVERRASGLTKEELFEDEVKVEKALKRLESQGGGLFVKGFPMRTVTVNHINNHLDMLKSEGFSPDVVFVDYWDLIKPSDRSGEYRHQLSSIGTSLRAMAQERNIAVWTASQVNRKAVDKKIIRKEDVAEAFEKIAIVDMAVAICQTKEERALDPSRARLFVAANREASDTGIAYITIDYDRMRIRPLRDDYDE